MSVQVAARPRLDSVDLLRGVIMVIMALDHVRDFVAFPANPTDMATTTPALFLTRWITHFCAPTFFLLTGMGAYLSLRKKSTSDLSRFLITRGIWLIFLEMVVVRCIAYQFNFDFHFTFFLILCGLGCAMILLGALLWLPLSAIIAIGAVMIAGHNLLDGVASTGPLWTLIHKPGFLIPARVFVAYPLIPWVGVTLLGFGLGRVFDWEPARRQKFLVRLGVTLTVAFVVLRLVNGYGDPRPWSSQNSGIMTVLSFLNVTKQAPSLLFLLMTLGPALVVLSWFDRGTPKILRPALTFGRVPLFYFVGHFMLAHIFVVVISLVRYGTAAGMFESPDIAHFPVSYPDGWGWGLPGVYLTWISVVVLKYPVCRWYAGLKQRRRDWWLSYL